MEPLKGGRLADPPAEARKLMADSGVKRTPVDWALQFLWNRPEVACVLSGMGTQRQVDENCASADRSGVGGLCRTTSSYARGHRRDVPARIAVPCTACRYCMPCPSGMRHPQNFAIWNNVSMKDKGFQQWRIKRSYGKLVRTPAKVDLEHPNGAASVCTTCRKCVPKCPQGIDIPTELVRCDAALR